MVKFRLNLALCDFVTETDQHDMSVGQRKKAKSGIKPPGGHGFDSCRGLGRFLCPTLVLSPGQTIATCQRNISQHCWAQHGHRIAMCCDMLGVVGSILTIFKFELTTPNMSQHIATRWPNARNMLRPTVLRYVALACCDRLAGALC